jgi:hypothetical protein
MHILRSALAGGLALTIAMAAQAAPPGAKTMPAGAVPRPAIAQIRDGNGPGWHPPTNAWRRGAGQIPGRSGQWNGRPARPPWGPNGSPWFWGFPPGPGVPTYWVWGPSGGAFDYPFADWRGPTGGWGNP